MTTVAILGAGVIGAAAARAIAAGGRVARVVLIDPSGPAAAGKALDIQQSGAIARFHARLEGTDDLSRAAACDVCVLADRADESAGEWRGDQGLALLSHAASCLGAAPVVLAGASQTGLIAQAVAEAGFEGRRLVGSAATAFASAVTAIVAAEAACAPADVLLTVLGVPPSGLVVAWAGGSIGGYPLTERLSPAAFRRVEARAAGLWPPGPHTLGAAAARIVHIILTSGRQVPSVFTWLTGEFGVRHRAGAVPARLGARGVVQTLVPDLTVRERVRVQVALGG